MDAGNNIGSSFPYSRVIVNCEGLFGKVRTIERNIPNVAIDRFVETVVSKFSIQYKTDNCITKQEAQYYFETSKADDFHYEPSQYAKSLIEQNKRINRKIFDPNHSGASMLGMVGITFFAGVFTYEVIHAYSLFKSKKVTQGLKHGLVATISLVVLMMFGDKMMKL